jgi:hypothetical protein
MSKPDDETKPQPQTETPPHTPEPVELQDELHRVLFDHEMERGTTITRTRQPRRRGRILRG